MSTADLTALDSQWKYALHYNYISINNTGLHDTSDGYLPILGFMVHRPAF